MRTGASAQPGHRPAAYYDQDRPEVAALVPPECRRVLDVGCGTGQLGRLLRARGHHVTGVELIPEAAAVARTYLDHVAVADIEAGFPFPPASFDAVIFADVLEHLVDPWRTLRGRGPSARGRLCRRQCAERAELRRALAPGPRPLGLPRARHPRPRAPALLYAGDGARVIHARGADGDTRGASVSPVAVAPVDVLPDSGAARGLFVRRVLGGRAAHGDGSGPPSPRRHPRASGPLSGVFRLTLGWRRGLAGSDALPSFSDSLTGVNGYFAGIGPTVPKRQTGQPLSGLRRPERQTARGRTLFRVRRRAVA